MLSDKFPYEDGLPKFVILIPKSEALTTLLNWPAYNVSICADGIGAVLLLSCP